MTGTMDRLRVMPDEHGRPGGLVLRRAWPRKPGTVLLELERPDGSRVPGQLRVDRASAARVVARTPGTLLHPTMPVVLHVAGADRVLRPLADLVAEDGARLVAHQPERRAVVRRPGGTFAKVVRPDRVQVVTGAHRAARAAGVPVARLVEVRAAGVVEWEPAPGRSLADLLPDVSVDLSGLRHAGQALGDALRRVHAASPPPGTGLRLHDVHAELATARHWVEQCAAHGLDGGDDAELSAVADRLRAAEQREPVAPVPLHRDLHEQQVFLAGDGAVTFIDLDTLALGDPVVDLANLLVHLRLAVRLGLPADRGRAVTDGVLEGYGPGPAMRRRLPAFEAVTALRLRGVHAFRPRSAHAARRLA